MDPYRKDIAKDITSTILRRSSKVVKNRNILFDERRMKHFYECVLFGTEFGGKLLLKGDEGDEKRTNVVPKRQ